MTSHRENHGELRSLRLSFRTYNITYLKAKQWAHSKAFHSIESDTDTLKRIQDMLLACCMDMHKYEALPSFPKLFPTRIHKKKNENETSKLYSCHRLTHPQDTKSKKQRTSLPKVERERERAVTGPKHKTTSAIPIPSLISSGYILP